jgi:hypothetical protein
MRQLLILGSLMLLATLPASTAGALDVDFNIATIETALPPGGGDELADLVIDANGDATTNMLAPGNLIALEVVISNPNNEFLTGIFTSLVFDGTVLDFVGSEGVPAQILAGGTTFNELALGDVGTGEIKVNSPNPDDGTGEVWLQATAFGSGGGTDGAGPDSYNLYFVLRPGVSGSSAILFEQALTPGDATDAPTLTLQSAYIQIPEPGTALLVGLGLIGLGAAGRRRSLSSRDTCS